MLSSLGVRVHLSSCVRERKRFLSETDLIKPKKKKQDKYTKSIILSVTSLQNKYLKPFPVNFYLPNENFILADNYVKRTAICIHKEIYNVCIYIQAIIFISLFCWILFLFKVPDMGPQIIYSFDTCLLSSFSVPRH